MNKTMLFIASCSLSLWSFGQIEIMISGQATDISGTVQHITTTYAQGTSSLLDLEVVNQTGSTDDFFVTRVNLDEPAGWENNLCWGVLGQSQLCYAANPITLWTIQESATLLDGEAALASPHFFAGDLGTSASYRYYFGTNTNLFMDSVDVQVHYILNVKEIKKDISLSVSPNPASDYVAIKVTNFEKGTLKIVDVLGNVILNENYFGSKTINVEDFKNGVYFIVISGEGMNTVNRKLVVRH